MKFEQYRQMDIALLSVMAVLAEALGIWLHEQLPLAGFYISFSTLVAIIALMRWGSWGVIANCLITVPAVLLGESKSIQLLVFYAVSNSAVIIVPILFKRLGTQQIISKSYWLLSYVAGFYGMLTISRGLLGFILGLSFYTAVIQTIAHLLLSMIMSYIILIIIKNREGLLVDMRTYFINKQEEREE